MNKVDSQTFLEAANFGGRGKRPPIHLWNPKNISQVDIRIAKDGRWYHEGDEIKRIELVKLFSSILRKEADGHYYLVTPHEKCQIFVEHRPFIAVSLFCNHQGKDTQELVLTTNCGDSVVVDAEHPLTVEYNDSEEPIPFVHVRDGLEALISRNVFYDLVELGKESQLNSHPVMLVRSCGEDYLLGKC